MVQASPKSAAGTSNGNKFPLTLSLSHQGRGGCREDASKHPSPLMGEGGGEDETNYFVPNG